MIDGLKKSFFRMSKLALAVSVVMTANSANAQLEEIIVTATKRAESVQDTAMSITALTSSDLDSMGAESLLDFSVRVPNLAMAYEADGRFDSSSPSIRGVFGRNTTGFYIDDTQVTASLLPRVVDLERIEVLRGPQGSLYGARSMGGTIRMITKQPSLTETEGSLKVGLSSVTDGDLNNSIDGSYSFPVSDNFGLRLSGYYGQTSGIQDRVYQATRTDVTNGVTVPNTAPAFATNENVDDETYWGFQAIGLWQINDELTFIPKFMTQRVDADGLPFADNTPENTTQLRFFDSEEPGTDEWSILSGTFKWDQFDGEFTSTTSYYDRTTDESEEEHSFLNFLYDVVIGLPIDPLESVLSTVEKYESITHETRFTSDYEGAVQFTAGVYYQDLELDHEYPPALQVGVNDALNVAAGGPADIVPGDLIFVTKSLTQTEEIAFFGEVSVQITDEFSITAGGRYYDTNVDVLGDSDGFANSGVSTIEARDENGNPLSPRQPSNQNESGFNPRVLAEYTPSDELNLFVSASKGFRIGGVNGNVPVGLCGPELIDLGIEPSNATSYDSDELWSYEIGAKTNLADNRYSINASLFFIDWQDIQQLNRLACGFQLTVNAGEAESKGFEVELNAAPTDNLTLTLGVGYTDAQITDAGGVAGVSNGDKIQGVPDWTFTGSAEYSFDINREWQGSWRVDANHYGDSFSSNNESSAANQRLREAWSAVNGRLTARNEKYEVTLFADNLTDERANLADSRSIAAETPGRQRLVTNRPRTYGVEAKMRF